VLIHDSPEPLLEIHPGQKSERQYRHGRFHEGAHLALQGPPADHGPHPGP
jgi:hypothetical protein